MNDELCITYLVGFIYIYVFFKLIYRYNYNHRVSLLNKISRVKIMNDDEIWKCNVFYITRNIFINNFSVIFTHFREKRLAVAWIPEDA